MSKVQVKTVPAGLFPNADQTLLSSVQTYSSAPGSLVLDGVSHFDGQVGKVTITSAGDDSGVTFSVTGTDIAGNLQQENIPGANTGTSSTNNFFTSVSEIDFNIQPADTVSAGLQETLLFVVFDLNTYAGAATTVGANVGGSGNVTIGVYFTLLGPDTSFGKGSNLGPWQTNTAWQQSDNTGIISTAGVKWIALTVDSVQCAALRVGFLIENNDDSSPTSLPIDLAVMQQGGGGAA